MGTDGRHVVRPGVSPLFVLILVVILLLVKNRCVFFWSLLFWMLLKRRARHPGPARPSGPHGISVEFINVGGWLSKSDLALDSQAHFLPITEHRAHPC